MKSAIIDQSQEFKVFDWLKFPLSVLVVLVHSHITGTSIRGETFLYLAFMYSLQVLSSRYF